MRKSALRHANERLVLNCIRENPELSRVEISRITGLSPSSITFIVKRLAKEKPDDRAACLLWCFAAKAGSVFLASGYPDEVAEELYATPIRSASEVQRLIDSAERVLLIPDAHRSMVTLS